LVLPCNTSCCSEALIYIAMFVPEPVPAAVFRWLVAEGLAPPPFFPSRTPFRVGTGAVSRWLKRGRHPPLPLRSVPFYLLPVSARASPVASLFRPILCPAWVSEWLKGCAGDEGTHLPFLVSSPSRAMPSVDRRQWLKGRHGPHSVLPSIILRPSEWLGGRLTPGIGLTSLRPAVHRVARGPPMAGWQAGPL
jgi:hypothetical protein